MDTPVSIKDVELLRFYPFGEFRAEWARLFWYMPVTVCMPTEAVVFKPEMVMPKLARHWDTMHYLVDGAIMNYDEVAKQRGFRGTSSLNEIRLLEVWCHDGGDGHVSWRHYGYRFADTKNLDEKMSDWRSSDTVPLLMTFGGHESDYGTDY